MHFVKPSSSAVRFIQLAASRLFCTAAVAAWLLLGSPLTMPAAHSQTAAPVSPQDTSAPSATANVVQPPEASSQTILAVLSSDKRFTELVKALKKSNVLSSLPGSGPYTVFAPTNDAIKKLSDTRRAAILSDKDMLAAVVRYHIIPAKLAVADIEALTTTSLPTTVEGDTIKFATARGVVTLNKSAKVVQGDLAASDGVIHVIDRVLLPPGVVAALKDLEDQAAARALASAPGAVSVNPETPADSGRTPAAPDTGNPPSGPSMP